MNKKTKLIDLSMEVYQGMMKYPNVAKPDARIIATELSGSLDGTRRFLFR
jgi:hypothetical protein